MTKVVLNNDTTKDELSMCTKLHYLENKYGKIAVYDYNSRINKWVRVYNPYSFCNTNVMDIIVYMDSAPDIIDIKFIKNHDSLYDGSILTLDKLRYDEAFIKVVENGDHVYGDDNLRIEESKSTYLSSGVRIEVDEETNREVAVFNPMWFKGELEYQYVEYDDAQDIDKVKDLLKDTIYLVKRVGNTSTLIISSPTSNFIFDTGNIVIKTKSRNVYVVDKETFDNWG